MKVYIDIRTGGTDNLTVIDLNEVIMRCYYHLISKYEYD